MVHADEERAEAPEKVILRDEIVERVRTAIATAGEENAGYKQMAIDAIAAMREPTEGMLSRCYNLPDPEYGRIFTPPSHLRTIWRAMIDAALREEDP